LGHRPYGSIVLRADPIRRPGVPRDTHGRNRKRKLLHQARRNKAEPPAQWSVASSRRPKIKRSHGCILGEGSGSTTKVYSPPPVPIIYSGPPGTRLLRPSWSVTKTLVGDEAQFAISFNEKDRTKPHVSHGRHAHLRKRTLRSLECGGLRASIRSFACWSHRRVLYCTVRTVLSVVPSLSKFRPK
jgi:hypothetical protein